MQILLVTLALYALPRSTDKYPHETCILERFADQCPEL